MILKFTTKLYITKGDFKEIDDIFIHNLTFTMLPRFQNINYLCFTSVWSIH